MARETTYLELSQDDGAAHKFYEVTVDGTAVSVRYGRIGADGQLQSSSFPTADKARAAAAKRSGRRSARGTPRPCAGSAPRVR